MEGRQRRSFTDDYKRQAGRQAEDCGRQMTDKHPKHPRDNTTPPPKKPR